VQYTEALFWNVDPLLNSVKTGSEGAIVGLRDFPSKRIACSNPVTGGVATGSCTAN